MLSFYTLKSVTIPFFSRQFILISFFILTTLYSQSQNAKWAWVSGHDQVNQNGIYGTIGIPGTANTPGARYRSIGLSDAQGNFYVFGGDGFPKAGTPGANISGALNDLWKFNPRLVGLDPKQWTWLSGKEFKNDLGNYGTKGIAAPTNLPPAREGAMGWLINNTIYIYGGEKISPPNYTPAFFNDMWAYDISTGIWTWIAGENTMNPAPVYGSKGNPSMFNTPGGRSGAATWVDLQGNLCLFGGTNQPSGVNNDPLTNGLYNDLWKFNTVTQEWTWAGGNHTQDARGVYGTKGVFSPANMPGARIEPVIWNHEGAIYMYGGRGFADANIPASAASITTLGDLWKLNLTTNEWTWINGSNLHYTDIVYGSSGVFAIGNSPGARIGAFGWVDRANDRLYITNGNYYANSTFAYNLQTNTWAWTGGSQVNNTYGIYGIKGNASTANMPGGRYRGLAWRDPDNSTAAWIFGGYGYASTGNPLKLNCLWYVENTPTVCYQKI